MLTDAPMARRGKRMLEAMLSVADGYAHATPTYTGRRRLLMMYGVGLPARHYVAQQHLRAGGHVAMWDLGYWQRDDHMRLAVDTLHPTAHQVHAAPGWPREVPALREDADPTGPVLIVGIGPKSCRLYGLAHMQWERRALQQVRQRYPGRRILWRPKGKDRTPLPGAEMVAGPPIDQVLRGCSLVVARHSNVAIDACIAGIPVVCEDGAAHALYGATSTPTPQQRAEFLARLSWFNWHPGQATGAWLMIQNLLQQ